MSTTVTTTESTESSAKDFAEGICELSSRSANGVDVALIWHQCDNTAVVVVVDHRSGETLLLDVGANDNALDMFHHPYAYAAQRRTDHDSRASYELRSAA
jgi:hypothetical protein